MKKIILIAAIALASGLTASAQRHHSNGHGHGNCDYNHGELVEKQTSVIIKSLELNDADAAKFEKVYGEYVAQKKAIRDKYKELNCRDNCEEGINCTPGQGKSRLSDAEVEARIQNSFKSGHEILNLREKYYKEFRKFLNPRQIQKIYNLEKRGASRFNRLPKNIWNGEDNCHDGKYNRRHGRHGNHCND